MVTSRRKVRTLSAVAATALGTGLILLPAGAAVAAPEDCAYMGYGSGPDQLGLQFDTNEQWVADNINSYRVQHGLPTLAVSEPLRRPAMWASLDDATRGYAPSDHIDTRGMGPAQRAAYCGNYTGARIGEINYWGTGGTADNPYYYGSGPAALSWWEADPPHNAILLSPDYTTFAVSWSYLGVNAEQGFWTVDFGVS
jgi:uncharacterized protein YkwD